MQPRVASNDKSKATGSNQIDEADNNKKPESGESKRSEIINQKTDSPPYYLFFLPSLMFLIPLAIWVFMRRSNATTTDSDEFNNALDIWHEVIFAKRPTPRSLKRFINRVRYFAMRQDSHEEDFNIWERFLHWLRDYRSKKEKELSKQEEIKRTKSSKRSIPEEYLVALSAIHYLNPDFIEKDGQLSKMIWMGVCDIAASKDIPVEMLEIMKKACVDHKKKFQHDENENWEEYRRLFFKMPQGIRVMS